jgi:hypothetical protein
LFQLLLFLRLLFRLFLLISPKNLSHFFKT